MAIGITPEEAKAQGLPYEDASAATRNVTQGVATDKAFNAISDTEMDSIDQSAEFLDAEAAPANPEDFLDKNDENKQPTIRDTALIEESYYASTINHSTGITPDPTEAKAQFDRMSNDLITTGGSNELSQAYNNITKMSKQLDVAAVTSVLGDPSISMDVKKSVVERFIARKGDVIDLRQEYINTLAANELVQAEVKGKPIDLSGLDERIQWEGVKAQLINGAAVQFDPSISAGFAGVLELVVPFLDQAMVNSLRDTVLDDQGAGGKALSMVLMGENKKALRDGIAAMPFEKRKEFTTKMIEAISALPGGDFKKMIYLNVFAESGEYADWERWIDNAVGILDSTIVLAPVGKLLKAGALTMKVHPASVIKTAGTVSKTESANLAATAMTDQSGELAKALGAKKVEIAAEHILPKMPEEVINDLPADVIDRIQEIDDLYTDLRATLDTAGINYQTVEKQAAVNAAVANLKAVVGLYLHVNKSVYTPDGGKIPGITVTTDGESISGIGIYGKDAENGFVSAKSAVARAIENNIPAEELVLYERGANDELTEVAISGKDLISGNRVPLPSKRGEFEGNYYVGRKFTRPFDARDSAALGSDGIASISQGRWAGYMQDITARLPQWWARAALKAADSGTAVEKRLLDEVRRDVSKLSRKGNAKLFTALEEGAVGDGNIWTATELATKYGMDNKEIQAYYTYRRVQDVAWMQTNRTFRKSLVAEGMKEIKGLGLDLGRQFVKPLARIDLKNITEVYDTVKKAVVPATKELLDEIYAGGGQIGKLQSGIKTAGNRTTHVIIDNKGISLSSLPANPLPYIKGYFQRSYKEHYFLDKVPIKLGVDGKLITDPAVLEAKYGSALAAGSSRKQLQAKAAQLPVEEGYYYNVRLANEIGDADVRDLKLRQSYVNAAKGRKEHLDGDIDHSLATIEDPMESLFRNIRTMSKYVAMDDFLTSSKARWVKTFGHASNGVYPSKFEDVSRALLADDAAYAAARTIHEQLGMMHSVASVSDIRWKSFILAAAETLEGGSMFAAKAVRNLADISPVNAIRSVPSNLFIALRPLRQLYIQPTQLLQLAAVNPMYLLSGQAPKELLALSLSRTTWGNAKLTAGSNKIGAKLFGVTEAEYSNIAKAYLDRSGLPYSIDSHIYVEGIVKDIHKSHLDTPIKRAADAALAVPRGIRDISKQAGFDTGEFINLTGSWLTARHRWMKANPEIASKWADKQYLDVIDADGRALSYAMNQPGSFKYQQGMLSIPLQFMSVPHKAFLSVLSEGLGGSRTLSSTSKYGYLGSEKARLAAMNLVMFGGVGVGMDSLITKILDEYGTDLTTDQIIRIKGGVLDTAMNSFLRTMSDDKDDGTNIKFSDSWSPIGDKIIPGAEILTHLLDGEVSALMGPSFHAFGRFKTVYEDIKVITALPEIDTKEKLISSLVAVGSLASGISDGLKYRIAMNSGVLVSTHGDAIVDATHAEAMGKLFGLQTYSEEAVWNTARKMGTMNQDAKDAAKMIHDAYAKQRIMYPHDRNGFFRVVEQIKAAEALMGPELLPMVQKELVKLETYSLETTEQNLTTFVINMSGAGDSTKEELSNTIQGSAMPQQNKDKILELMDMGFK